MAQEDQRTEQLLSLVVDPVWYRARHRDVAVSGADPLRHFIESGLHERRDPNRWFDGAWYARQYADVAASGAHPLLHYMAEGAKQGRDPHPRFDAGWYVDQHPEAAGNPLLFHLRVGAARGWLTERPVAIEDYLPSTRQPFAAPAAVAADVIIPVHGGHEITRRCLNSVLADADRPAGRIIVIDDRSPEPKLRAWLVKLAKTGAITLLRNARNLGFVASVNRGIRHAGEHDVALLNSDTEVPPGWLRRLQAQACAAPGIASVSPLSNNATICSYLGYEGAPIPAGMSLSGIDAACREVNAGRFADAPTTVGFCMYIRREALNAVGLFDEATFDKGYGEENDFCLRASAMGWRHRIACDTFVYHEGGASFGTSSDAGITRAFAILTERYPDYAPGIARFVDAAETEPARFAMTMSLFRTSGLPTILVLSHEPGGGVRRHVADIIAGDRGRANYLVLEPASRGVALSVPALSGHPKLVLAAERWRDVAAVARSGGVTRVHIHHLMGLDLDARALIHDLDVPFDVTVHDYFAICPQVTLLPWTAGRYCGEPGPDGCDACIANRPSHGATDILAWRLRWAWQFREAARVFAPSQDTLQRLRRYGLGLRATVLPHEPVPPGPWPFQRPPRPGKPLRVAVLGVLADHKGAQLVASVAMAADAGTLALQVLGPVEATIPDAARQRMTINGPYLEGELPALLAKYRPHVIWFPAPWPETYSFTLSAAIASGLPVVASEIGAFPERLAGRPFTWVIPPTLDPAAWLAVFETVAGTLRARMPPAEKTAPRPTASRLSAPRPTASRLSAPRLTAPGPTAPCPTAPRPSAPRPSALVPVACSIPNEEPADENSPRREPPGSSRRDPRLVELRRDGATAVVVVPETFEDGSFTPCAHIRLLRPLDHPQAGRGIEITVTDAMGASRYHADVIVTQRHAVPSLAAARALVAHAQRTRASLVFDLDDDLLNVPADHPEAADLSPRAAVVEFLIRHADLVRTSTPVLAARIEPLARRVQVIENALDERIWLPRPRDPRDDYGPVRILCMGTATHDADFALISPALEEIHRQFGDQVRIDLIGFVAMTEVPSWIRRLRLSPHAARSYPGFVNWLTAASPGPWDIGLAPLGRSRFNACKSAIKALDYAALGLATLASDQPAYRGSVADGAGGMLVAENGWHEALSRLIRDTAARRALAAGGAMALRASGTLEARADTWRRAWEAPGI